MGAIQYYRSTGLGKKFDFGNTLWTDGVDDSIHIPPSASMDFTGKSWTVISFTFSPTLEVINKNFLSNWNGLDSSGRRLQLLNGWSDNLGQGVRIMNNNGGFVTGFTASGTSLVGYEPGKWVYRVWQYDREGVNGRPHSLIYSMGLVNNGDTIGVFPAANSSYNVNYDEYDFLGKTWSLNMPVGNNTGGLRSEKFVDNLVFFDRALNVNELLKLYNDGKGYLPTNIPNCVACYLFNEPSGTAVLSSSKTPGSTDSRIIYDTSGNDNHAYAVGYSPGSTDFVNHNTLT